MSKVSRFLMVAALVMMQQALYGQTIPGGGGAVPQPGAADCPDGCYTYVGGSEQCAQLPIVSACDGDCSGAQMDGDASISNWGVPDFYSQNHQVASWPAYVDAPAGESGFKPGFCAYVGCSTSGFCRCKWNPFLIRYGCKSKDTHDWLRLAVELDINSYCLAEDPLVLGGPQ